MKESIKDLKESIYNGTFKYIFVFDIYVCIMDGHNIAI